MYFLKIVAVLFAGFAIAAHAFPLEFFQPDTPKEGLAEAANAFSLESRGQLPPNEFTMCNSFSVVEACHPHPGRECIGSFPTGGISAQCRNTLDIRTKWRRTEVNLNRFITLIDSKMVWQYK